MPEPARAACTLLIPTVRHWGSIRPHCRNVNRVCYCQYHGTKLRPFGGMDVAAYISKALRNDARACYRPARDSYTPIGFVGPRWWSAPPDCDTSGFRSVAAMVSSLVRCCSRSLRSLSSPPTHRLKAQSSPYTPWSCRLPPSPYLTTSAKTSRS